MAKWVRQTGLGLLGVIGLAVGVGATYEMVSRSLAPRDYPPLGKLIDIGGRRIQLDCRGTGSPVVVFESGMDARGSLSWTAVHDAIAQTTRACAYSRAGILWSDPREGPQSGSAAAQDLHALLTAAGEPGPYVLVGHSLGGPFTMIYTKRYPSDVAGLVFVDASHPDQNERFKSVTPVTDAEEMRTYRLMCSLAWTGVFRMWVHAEGARAAYASPSCKAALKDLKALDQIFSEAGSARELGDRPLFVLTGMAPLSAEEVTALKMTDEQGRQFMALWKTLHDDEATWSTRSQHQVVPDATHYIQFDRPDVVIAAVRSVVESVRAGAVSR